MQNSYNRLVVLLLVISSVLLPICNGLVRLATWNLLAPQYARPYKYPWCEPRHLQWDHRKTLIIPQLLDIAADIVCLQEVQVDLWPELIAPLESLYDGMLQNVTRGHNVASAILLRKGCSLEFERVESRSRILISVMRDITKDAMLYVCSVHLEAGMEECNDLHRYFQLKSLFKRLRRQCKMDGNSLEDATIILAGDFNMLSSNLMYQCLSTGKLIHPENSNEIAPIDIVAFQSSVRPHKTFARGSVLDYIWTSRTRVQVGQPLCLSSETTNSDPRMWPCHDYPSDHLPIGVELMV